MTLDNKPTRYFDQYQQLVFDGSRFFSFAQSTSYKAKGKFKISCLVAKMPAL